VSTAEKIRERRLRMRLTQDQMERLTGIDQAYFSLIENGHRRRISGELLVKIARALNCTVEDLVARRQPAVA
jgi:transcriptional regulator with XRE-family HTH domain